MERKTGKKEVVNKVDKGQEINEQVQVNVDPEKEQLKQELEQVKEMLKNV